MLAVVVAIPAIASASGVSNVINQIGVSGGSGGSSGSGGDTSRAGVPPTYVPPLHGTNPHGQGTNAVVDLTPGTSNPYSSDPTKSGEEVVVGNSRGDQNSDGTYSGNVTLLYLFGNPIVQVKSDPSNNGETQHGPLQPLQTQLLDAICQNSNGQACITLLKMDSTSNSNSSTNAFEALGVHLGGDQGLNADVLTSDGNISSDGTTQTSHGDSSAAHVTAGGNPVLDALQGTTDSSAGPGGNTQNNSSTTLSLGGNGLPIPAQGCADGTANTVFNSLAPLLATVCGADDTNGSQTSAPYGVREALALFALINGDSPVLKVSGGNAESHAVAPAGNTTPTPGPGTGGTKGAGGKGGNKGGNGNGGNGGNAGANGSGAGAGAGAAANNAAAGNGQLAFTGADLLALAVIGGALILGGLALTTTAGRRHRQTV